MRQRPSEERASGPAPRGRRAPAPASAAPGHLDSASPTPHDAAQRLASLTHELASLLDGSMRTVNLVLAGRAADEHGHTEDLEASDRRLRSVKVALEQMAGMVQAAVREATLAGRRARRITRASTAALTVADAVKHASAILEPLAAENHVEVHTHTDPQAAALPAGPVYPIITNGVRNAIESIAASGRTGPRQVTVAVSLRADHHILIEIADTGAGPPEQLTDPAATGPRPFQPGFTTKRGGAGLGLAFCRDLLMQHGGTIRLLPRPDHHGAILIASYPARPLADRSAA